MKTLAVAVLCVFIATYATNPTETWKTTQDMTIEDHPSELLTAVSTEDSKTKKTFTAGDQIKYKKGTATIVAIYKNVGITLDVAGKQVHQAFGSKPFDKDEKAQQRLADVLKDAAPFNGAYTNKQFKFTFSDGTKPHVVIKYPFKGFQAYIYDGAKIDKYKIDKVWETPKGTWHIKYNELVSKRSRKKGGGTIQYLKEKLDKALVKRLWCPSYNDPGIDQVTVKWDATTMVFMPGTKFLMKLKDDAPYTQYYVKAVTKASPSGHMKYMTTASFEPETVVSGATLNKAFYQSIKTFEGKSAHREYRDVLSAFSEYVDLLEYDYDYALEGEIAREEEVIRELKEDRRKINRLKNRYNRRH